jgi:hypothetical protein
MEANLFTVAVLVWGPRFQLRATLSDLEKQSFPCEIMIVCPEEMIKAMPASPKYRLVSSPSNHPAALANLAIQKARGVFLLFFLPGETFISHDGLFQIQKQIEEHPYCDVYQFGHMDLTLPLSKATLSLPLEEKYLKNGKLPSKLCSTAISLSFLKKTGIRFDGDFSHRVTFAFFCNLLKKGKYLFVHRMVTKGSGLKLSLSQKWIYFWETYQIIRKYLGFKNSLKFFIVPIFSRNQPLDISVQGDSSGAKDKH